MTLSSGAKAKVAFVSAEACRPRVLLLDEPTAGRRSDLT
ncbi:MAG: ATP-binding cassette domain-containing protein [Gemmatimonadales bacterium]|nr:ATP-binding cassette domain-containing protein [Gemmatimonadales bacterium]MYG49077.1 ATP-binding cassette domain-containing protein [Gemmatimonadales bacterium]MYK02444.1 ATP-binding cassette domain-containing protein [Candidatus Palauibacter ramosifaciens]